MTAPPSVRRECTCPRAQHQHGTLGAYQLDGCRCFRCRLNKSQARYRYQHSGNWREYAWQSAVGVARRLQALSAIGYTDRQLADHTGIHVAYLSRLRAQNAAQVITARTFEKIARCYDALWCVPQIGPYATRAKRAAARKGWLPPLAWDDDTIDSPEDFVHILQNDYVSGEALTIDEIAVAEAIQGRRVRLTKAEESEAVRRMTAWGYSADEIGERIGKTGRTVVRKRSAA